MSTVTLRPITTADWPAFASHINDAFGNIPDEADLVAPPDHALERCVGAFSSTLELIGTGVNHSMQLTMPGGKRVPVAGVAGISVAQTHRRQGVMSALIDWLVADASARGEVASVLTASEGSIYWKRGYGPATWAMTGEVHGGARLYPASAVHLPTGTLRLIRDPALVIQAMAEIHERACIARPGSISRPAHEWPEMFRGYTADSAHWRLVVHTSVDGVDDGYAFYGMAGEWSSHSVSEQKAHVHELVSVGPVAHRAIWQHLLELDLSSGVQVTRIGLADPIKLMLEDPRALRVTGVMDRLWVRPLDIAQLLNSRSLGHGDPVLIDVEGTVFELTSGGCTPSHAGNADLSMTLAGLGAVSLGGTSAADLVAAGRIVEHRLGAAVSLDQLLRTSPAPMMTTAF